MSEVKTKWNLTKLGELSSTTSGGTPSRKRPDYYQGDIPWVKSGDLNNSYVRSASECVSEEGIKNSSAKIFSKGTLMIALYGATIGKLGILDMDAATNQAICGIFESELIDTKYLFYFLMSQKENLIKQGKGGAQPNISQKIIRDIDVPYPESLTEQRQIVQRIESLFSRLDAGVASLQHAKAQLQRYRQSVLTAAVTGELTQAWRKANPDTEPASKLLKRILQQRREQWNGRGKYKEPIEPDVTKMPSIPKSWSWARLDSICAIGSGMSVSKNRKFKKPVEVPYLRVANVQRGKLLLDNIKVMSIEADKLDGLKLKDGDILFNEGGDRDKLGRGWIWEGQISPCITQNHVFRAAPYSPTDSLARFISHWGNTFGQQFFLDEGTQTTNLASINKGVLSSFPIPLSPLAEQHRIVAEVEARTSSIDHLEGDLDQQLTRAIKLRQSILASKFNKN